MPTPMSTLALIPTLLPGGLLLPAIQSVRDAACAESGNRVKQIELAIHVATS